MTRNLNRLDSINIENKRARDFVSDVDRQSEFEIINIIRRAYPDHSILAEESGDSAGSSTTQWIIDPLDGTTNYLHGFPQFAVSIAVKMNNVLEAGVVYDPMLQELFVAARGQGATLNDRRIRVSNRIHLDTALLGTGLPYLPHHDFDTYLRQLSNTMRNVAGIRRAGSAALDLAYVASGRLDGFWENSLNIWDIAAGVLLVQEAGGLVTDTKGGTGFLQSGNIACGNPKIHPQLLKLIQ